jgi:hypothetical protein
MTESPKLQAKTYSCRFLEAGVVKYDNEMVYISQENLMQIAEAFKGTPMVIDHQDINVSNADELKFGHALNIRKGEDGWAWCDFTSDSDEAINLINEGWSVSCAYVPTKTADAGVYHNIPYDREILEAKALHIAIVQKPRYEKALVFENSLTINKNNMSNELLDSIKNAITAIPSAIAEGFRSAKKNESEDKEDDKKENEEKKDDNEDKKEAKKNKKYNGEEDETITIGDDEITIKELASMLKNRKKKNEKEEDEDEKKDEKKNSSLLNSMFAFNSGQHLSNLTPSISANPYEIGKKFY